MKGKTQVPDGWELRDGGLMLSELMTFGANSNPSQQCCHVARIHGLIPQMELFQRQRR